MKIYYLETTSKGVDFYEIEHDQRHLFWVSHPNSKEISKKEFFNIMDEANKKASEQKEQDAQNPIEVSKP